MFGLVNGIGLGINHAWKAARLPTPPRLIGWALTIVTILITLVYFRSTSLAQAHTILGDMFLPSGPLAVPFWVLTYLPFDLMRQHVASFTLFAEASTTAHMLGWIIILGPLVVETLTDDSNIDLFQIKAAVRTLDAAAIMPQVVITGYSGGAHCCTSTTIATSGADGTWKSMTPPQIDGDVGYNFLDLTHDGSSVLVDAAEGFNYEFSSYAGSYSPTRIQELTGSKLDDMTKDPRYRDFLLLQLRGMEASAAQGLSEQNGYLAGWVAQKTLVGQLDDGWRTMLRSYDRQSTNGRTACTLDKRVWVPGRYGSGLECPEGQEAMLQFPEALARHLLDLGYLTGVQSAQLGFDPVRIEAERQAATIRYEDQMLHGWFVINRNGTCMLSRTPVSPAAMVTGDRARGVEDDVAVLTAGDDGKPSVVRVGEPKGNGLLTAITFYRGVAKYKFTRQQQKKDLEKLYRSCSRRKPPSGRFDRLLIRSRRRASRPTRVHRKCRQCRSGRRSGHGKNSHRDSPWRSSG